jgi:hypothetical protein
MFFDGGKYFYVSKKNFLISLTAIQLLSIFGGREYYIHFQKRIGLISLTIKKPITIILF